MEVRGSGCAVWITALLIPVAGCAYAPSAGPEQASRAWVAMTVTAGLSDYQVVQRDEKDQGTIRCEGTCEAAGEVWASVVESHAGQGPDRDVLQPRKVGEARDGRWSATIQSIPVGGGYTVRLWIRGASQENLARAERAHHVLVGDLWILAGQSNMQGVGDMTDVEPPSEFVHSYGMNKKWELAEEPLHRLNESPDPVHHPGLSPEAIEKARSAPRQQPAKGAGLGLPFAKELYARTKVPIGLVPCAHGGTSMDQWDPAKKDLAGRSLYGSMLRRFHAVGGRVKGVLWYQGESEANAKSQPVYRQKFKRFIQVVRDDFGDPRLPFYLVQISRVAARWDDAGWSGVREDQRVVGEEVPGAATVSAIDLDLDDLIHVGTPGLKRLGRRLAVVVAHDLFGQRAVATGPRLKSAAIEDAEHGVVRVVFDHVNGRLRPDRQVAGFSLRDADGREGPLFYDVVVDPARPNTILCQQGRPIPPGMNLWYGYGVSPYCNLADEQDMAAPAFGPVPLTPPATQSAPVTP